MCNLTFEATIYMYFLSVHDAALEGDGQPAGYKACEVLAINKELRDADQEARRIPVREVKAVMQ